MVYACITSQNVLVGYPVALCMQTTEKYVMLQSQNKQCRIYDHGNILLPMVPSVKTDKYWSYAEQGMDIGNGFKSNLVHHDVK